MEAQAPQRSQYLTPYNLTNIIAKVSDIGTQTERSF